MTRLMAKIAITSRLVFKLYCWKYNQKGYHLWLENNYML